jgi:CheY-like chemotaxis protein
MHREALSELVRQYKTNNDIYHDLMQSRVREILLVATVYDAFILEEEDRLSETIFGEYHQLNLSTAPRITSVSFGEEALETLRYRRFDMVILTMRIDEISPFELARKIREENASVPILLLLNDNSEIRLVEERKDRLKYFEKIFVWNGDSKIFLAMIKYIEDKINVDKDTRIGLVRVILLVEDSIRYYSRYLPILYSEIMRQTQRIIADEGLNEAKKLLRMRARPKVLMAESYEEAVELIDRYRDYLLALISDVRFPEGGVREAEAGSHLIRHVRQRIPDLPILLQSAEAENAALAESLGVSFLDKRSENLSRELTDFIFNFLGFGDFVFRDAAGRQIARARSLEQFKELLLTVPDDSLVYHAERNHFSGWLMARGEIQIARNLQPVKVSDFPDVGRLRQHLLEVYREVQANRTRGRIIQFSESPPDEQHHVIRLSEGSLGGKGRGMAFLHLLIQNCGLERYVPQVDIRIPQTWVIGTEEYDAFIERNGLTDLFPREEDYRLVKRRFLAAELSPELKQKLRAFLDSNRRPLSVRSSGMFEDSISQPFSGIYDTYLIGNDQPEAAERQRQLEAAIKLVYASILSPPARAYFESISYMVDEEKMAVLIQDVVGRPWGRWFYPHLSGVAQSYNYYPLAYIKPEDGVAVLAVGLGKHVIDGEKAFHFCPQYPRLDFLPPEDQLAGTQDSFYAIDLGGRRPDLAAGEEATLQRLPIAEAQADPAMRHCLSVWDWQNNRLSLEQEAPGPRVVNFASLLKYDSVPLAQTLSLILDMVKGAMGTPVEIEFAADLGRDPGDRPQFHVLQIKPLLANLEEYDLDVQAIKREELLLYAERAMGNGRIGDLCDLIYADPERFDRARMVEMAEELGTLNAGLKHEGRRYILIGPGRWGSKDHWLGIPVNWNHISAVRVIVEAELPDFKVDPSLGSHFFHNVTSMNIGYFDVPSSSNSAFLDWAWLKAQEPRQRTEHFVHLRSDRPWVVKMDGRKRVSAVFKP